jgi:hypothetical protein
MTNDPSHGPPTISRVLLHDRYGFVLTVVAAVGAIAAIGSLLRPELLPAVRVYLRVTVVAVAVQVLIGVVLFATGSRPSQLLHWLYGAATLITLPLAMWLGGKLGRREQHVWLVGGAILTVLFAFRAIATG